jgi:exodeoxyribonuclease VII small subunit
MAKSRKNLSKETPDGELSFEAALARLETIVTEMESEELNLEALLTHYREGAKLAGLCQTKLSQAEVVIQRLDEASPPPAETPVDGQP